MEVTHPNTFRLIIASVSETLYDEAVLSATFPGVGGIFTVLPHHEPLITTLKKGEVVVKTSIHEPQKFPVETGVVECSGNRVVVLL